MKQGGERNAMARSLEILRLAVITARDGELVIELTTMRKMTTLHGDRLSAPEPIQVFSEINATASIPAIVVLPDTDIEIGKGSKDAVALLNSALPSTVHRIAHGTGLNRMMATKPVELGTVSP
jgi:hypothetical protein